MNTTLFNGAVLATMLFALSGCDQEKDKLAPPPVPGKGRSDAVTASNTATTKAVNTANPTPKPATPPRQLCVGQSPRPAPTGTLSSAAAPGSAPPPSLTFGVGKWVWLNLWAAWCKPCKEEMPRLIGWQPKLRAKGILVDLAFVSLDEDERQFQRFLEEQPKDGVRASYWLPEGSGRTTWLGALGVKETPELPVQALVAPSGQVACVIQGAVEDTDYPALEAFLLSQR